MGYTVGYSILYRSVQTLSTPDIAIVSFGILLICINELQRQRRNEYLANVPHCIAYSAPEPVRSPREKNGLMCAGIACHYGRWPVAKVMFVAARDGFRSIYCGARNDNRHNTAAGTAQPNGARIHHTYAVGFRGFCARDQRHYRRTGVSLETHACSSSKRIRLSPTHT